MSSFHKASDSSVTVFGSKNKNNLPIVSSGIPSLDHLIGGGLPSGAIFAVEEDVLGNYSRVLSKYFLAEGIVCKHSLLVASADEDLQDIMNELPVPCAAPNDDGVPSAAENLDKMKIAWRYEGLGQVESSFGSNTNFGHHFDLSKHVDSDTLKKSDITYWSPSEERTSTCNFGNILFYDLLKKIKEAASREEFQASCKNNKNILRINILSLGSPTWMASAEDINSSPGAQDLVKFMYCLRTIMRDTTAVAFVTIPAHLLDDESLVSRLLYSVDNAVRVESFAGSSREANPAFREYHGLFHVRKLSPVHALLPHVPPSLDLAFKLRRKKFIIEKLHLPPELQESSEREQDDITATPKTCGGFKKKDIDF